MQNGWEENCPARRSFIALHTERQAEKTKDSIPGATRLLPPSTEILIFKDGSLCPSDPSQQERARSACTTWWETGGSGRGRSSLHLKALRPESFMRDIRRISLTASTM